MYFHDETSEHSLIEAIRREQVDVLFVVGWSHLMSSALINSSRQISIGFHPSPLPKGRGRHPLIWAMVLGLSETASTFFELQVEADAGDIINQAPIKILHTDDAGTLYERILSSLPSQVDSIIEDITLSKIRREPQNHKISTRWRKRTRTDGIIDWRMSARAINNLVRALRPPYPDAEYVCAGEYVTLWECDILNDDPTDFAEPGKIIGASSGKLVIQCGEGALSIPRPDLLRDASIGEYI